MFKKDDLKTGTEKDCQYAYKNIESILCSEIKIPGLLILGKWRLRGDRILLQKYNQKNVLKRENNYLTANVVVMQELLFWNDFE